MSKGKRTPSGGYAQNWAAYNAAKINQKPLFRPLLYELCSCVVQPEQVLGRPRLPLSDVIFCLVFKTYLTHDYREAHADMEEAREKGFIHHVPHFNSLSHYLRMEWLTPILTRLIELSSLPLEPFETDFAVDATGFSTDRYALWLDDRTQQEKTRRKWVKVHLICGVKTHIVTSVIVSPGHESKFMGRLVAATANNFKVKEVSADRGYISGENIRHVIMASATPFIAFKSNHRLDADYKSTIWKRMLSMFLHEHEKFMAHYNKRNNVETVFSMIKANFNDYMLGRDERALVNEALTKVLCHNLCVLIQAIYELGIAPKFEAVINPDEEAKQETEKLGPVADGRLVVGVQKTMPSLAEDQGIRSKRKRTNVGHNQLSLFSEEDFSMLTTSYDSFNSR